MITVVLVLALGLTLLACVLLVKTARFTSKQVHVPPVPPITLDERQIAEHLSRAIRFRTVSDPDPGAEDADQFHGLIDYLEQTFPSVHATLNKEVLGGGSSLLFTWQGQDRTLKPLLLAAHLDVVPADAGHQAAPRHDWGQGPRQLLPLSPQRSLVPAAAGEQPWKYLPFEGVIAEGFIWGRGTLDDKVSVLGILEAAELLVREGYRPRRTILLAFGQDEEVGGKRGAQAIAAQLQARGARLGCVLDEGSSLVHGILPGLAAPIGLVGTAEKGYVDLELAAQAAGGHTSMPPTHTAIGLVGRAITRLEEHPYPAKLEGVSRQLFETIGPEFPFRERLVFANLWLLRPLLERRLAATASTNALIRSTAAVTLIEGGIKDNVLPETARAVANFRLLPGNTADWLVPHVAAIVADPQVKVGFAKESEPFNPSKISSASSTAYRLLERTIRQIFPESVVAPFLVTAGTDSRFYEEITDDTYRFLPIRLGPDDLDRIHGTNERISIEDYAQVVTFYHQLLRSADEF